jgi:hypothetical protein
MKTFTIENETNNITHHATTEAAQAVPAAEAFKTAEEFTSLASAWPTSRLIEIWNGIAGLTPVKKFKDRATATARIWAAVQSLGGDAASEPAEETQASAPATEPGVIAKEVAPGTIHPAIPRRSTKVHLLGPASPWEALPYAPADSFRFDRRAIPICCNG